MAGLLAMPLALLAALIAAAGMGFAIQQGGTCMVSALDQLVNKRAAGKLVALAECGVWTSALGLLAVGAGFAFAASPAYPLGPMTLLGGLLLGTGAWLNGACVFGSIARIGGHDWHYLLTPPGYLLGCLVHAAAFGGYPSGDRAPVSGAVLPVMTALIGLGLVASVLAWHRSGRSLGALWDYRHATIAIGIAFVVLAVIAGPWTYTEALGSLAHGIRVPSWQEAALFAALLGGALMGGGKQAARPPLALRRALACLGGGALMGLGGSLIPGGNDNLILVGLPGLQPHALVAIAAMAAAIALGLIGENAWRKFLAFRAAESC
jgi:toxin CptA